MNRKQALSLLFSAGTDGIGIGGPHVGLGYVWPMSIIMRAITSDDDGEILYCLDMLKRTTAGACALKHHACKICMLIYAAAVFPSLKMFAFLFFRERATYSI